MLKCIVCGMACLCVYVNCEGVWCETMNIVCWPKLGYKFVETVAVQHLLIQTALTVTVGNKQEDGCTCCMKLGTNFNTLNTVTVLCIVKVLVGEPRPLPHTLQHPAPVFTWRLLFCCKFVLLAVKHWSSAPHLSHLCQWKRSVAAAWYGYKGLAQSLGEFLCGETSYEGSYSRGWRMLFSPPDFEIE